jgi:hypothetical protein
MGQVNGGTVKSRVARAICLACLSTIAARQVAAQAVTGSVYGTATDTSGARLPGVTVTLSSPATTPVTFNIATKATTTTTAVAGSDYTAKSQTSISISAGITSKNFLVSIRGDTVPEPDETFFVTLSGVTGATVADGQAVGTIRNDDGGGGGGGGTPPNMTIANVTTVEGNSGSKQAVFTVKLSSPAPANVTYSIATADGTAKAGSDYVAASATSQVISAGQSSKTFSVTINGDTTYESTERFKVNISGVTGAVLTDAQGVGIISNDD